MKTRVGKGNKRSPVSSQKKPFSQSCLKVVDEIETILREDLSFVSENEFRTRLEKCFGSIERGYGALVAVRNVLRSSVKAKPVVSTPTEIVITSND
jgi:hypothetical protein